MKLLLGRSYTFLRGYDQNSQPHVKRGTRLSLRREMFERDKPAVAACVNGRRVVGRINLDDALKYNSLLRELPSLGVEASAVVIEIGKDLHRRRNGARYEYTRIDIRVEYKANGGEGVRDALAATAAQKDVYFRPSLASNRILSSSSGTDHLGKN